jgi:hypothetical protein
MNDDREHVFKYIIVKLYVETRTPRQCLTTDRKRRVGGTPENIPTPRSKDVVVTCGAMTRLEAQHQNHTSQGASREEKRLCRAQNGSKLTVFVRHLCGNPKST